MIPLIDDVGLYPGGNQVPITHAALGLVSAMSVRGRNFAGDEVETNGRTVIASLGGMSNAKREWAAFMKLYRTKYGLGRRLTFHNGNRGAWDAKRIAVDEPAAYWQWFMAGLAKRNLSPAQVQVAWIKNSVRGQNKPYPADADELRQYLEIILQAAVDRFPNLSQVVFSSAIYSGYNTKPTPRKEPHAFNEGLGVKALVEAHLGQVKPWIAWSGYLWADGATPRSDGLVWLRSDFETDMVHPGPTGEAKVAAMLMKAFETNSATAGWFKGI